MRPRPPAPCVGGREIIAPIYASVASCSTPSRRGLEPKGCGAACAMARLDCGEHGVTLAAVGLRRVMQTDSMVAYLPLRLELGVPIEVVEPALVQVIRGKQAPVAMQMMHGWLERHLRRPHAGF